MLVTATVFVTTRNSSSGSASAKAAAEAFLAAGDARDWTTSWEMLCARDRLVLGPREFYLEERAATDTQTAAARAGFDLMVGDVRYVRDAPAYVVELRSVPDHGDGPVEAVVVEEDGDFRVCGMR